ncbi:class I SAM-dependent methyltransferase [Amnibacterium kyonggiense]|uniref:class I SAM-dependent methyltransferase n=1 Tax=Amnibacterium kyonggiense TaxID=595671 RepID=UPI001FEAC4F3|nr:class I SAM-dependent methyltransferase [Amnibacterium kyonggiense]
MSGEDAWSAVAAGWAATWGVASVPAHAALLDAADVGAGTRLLDVGCGSGELLRLAADRGARVAGCDPASGMLALARRSVPVADLRDAGTEDLPWPEGSFDVVTAVNALAFAEDEEAAFAELRRVLAPGGRLGIANWAEHAANDRGAIEAAVAEADGEEPSPDPPERLSGGLERLLGEQEFAVEIAGIAEVPWTAPDDAALIGAVLLGEDASVLRELGPVVVAAAAPFRTASGGYRLMNRFRWAVAGS